MRHVRERPQHRNQPLTGAHRDFARQQEHRPGEASAPRWDNRDALGFRLRSPECLNREYVPSPIGKATGDEIACRIKTALIVRQVQENCAFVAKRHKNLFEGIIDNGQLLRAIRPGRVLNETCQRVNVDVADVVVDMPPPDGVVCGLADLAPDKRRRCLLLAADPRADKAAEILSRPQSVKLAAEDRNKRIAAGAEPTVLAEV